MIVEFEAALNYINLGNYDKAEELLKTAIEKVKADDESLAIEYTCVLAELYANTSKVKEARESFEQVIKFSDDNHILQKQAAIAHTYIDAFDGKLKPAAAPERPKNIPLIPKPVQNKSFIAKQLNKH